MQLASALSVKHIRFVNIHVWSAVVFLAKTSLFDTSLVIVFYPGLKTACQIGWKCFGWCNWWDQAWFWCRYSHRSTLVLWELLGVIDDTEQLILVGNFNKFLPYWWVCQGFPLNHSPSKSLTLASASSTPVVKVCDLVVLFEEYVWFGFLMGLVCCLHHGWESFQSRTSNFQNYH